MKRLRGYLKMSNEGVGWFTKIVDGGYVIDGMVFQEFSLRIDGEDWNADDTDGADKHGFIFCSKK